MYRSVHLWSCRQRATFPAHIRLRGMSKTEVQQPRMLLEVVRENIRLRHLSYATEKHYLHWIHRFIRFHCKRHPKDMGEPEIVAFLSDLAIQRDCAPGTQNQALNAIVFLFRNVLGRDLGEFKNVQWARRKRRAPEVMTRDELTSILKKLQPNAQKWLVASLLYGCGMRLSEALRLRVKDVDFGQGIIVIRDAKGDKDRIVPLPKRLVAPLKEQLSRSSSIHQADLKVGLGRVPYLTRSHENIPTPIEIGRGNTCFHQPRCREILARVRSSAITYTARIWRMR
jgi:integrase